MDINTCRIFILIVQGVLASVITVKEGDVAIIDCPLDGNYKMPTWTGPDTLANPLTFSNNFREPGMQWANTDFQDIKISKVGIEHRGNYTCEDDSGRNATVELEVEYFKEGSANQVQNPIQV